MIPSRSSQEKRQESLLEYCSLIRHQCDQQRQYKESKDDRYDPVVRFAGIISLVKPYIELKHFDQVQDKPHAVPREYAELALRAERIAEVMKSVVRIREGTDSLRVSMIDVAGVRGGTDGRPAPQKGRIKPASIREIVGDAEKDAEKTTQRVLKSLKPKMKELKEMAEGIRLPANGNATVLAEVKLMLGKALESLKDGIDRYLD